MADYQSLLGLERDSFSHQIDHALKVANLSNGAELGLYNTGEIELSDLLASPGQQRKRRDRKLDGLETSYSEAGSEENIASLSRQKRYRNNVERDLDSDEESSGSPTFDEDDFEDNLDPNMWNSHEDIEEWLIGAQSTVDVPDCAFGMHSKFLDSSALWRPDESIFLELGNSSSVDMECQSQLDSQTGFDDNSIICYGMIHNVRVKVLPQTPQQLKVIETAQNSFQTPHQRSIFHFGVTIVGDSDSYFLRLPEVAVEETTSSHNIAVLNRDGAMALSKTASFCTFEAYSSPEHWTPLIDGTMTIEKNTLILVDIILYGLSMHCLDVGEILTTEKIWLQEPDYWRPGLQYHNPHFLDLSEVHPEEKAPIGPSGSLFTGADFRFGLETPEDSGTIQTPLKQKITAAFKSATRAGDLQRIVADIRIRTPLKFYQEEALDFIAQREHGPVPQKYCLWKPKSSLEGTLFENVITGCEKKEMPMETGGGILADDMGLGKTLTMLSAIIRTTEEAKAFAAHEETSYKPRTDHIPIRSRATLVVVPTPMLINEWRQEISLIYHGQGREGDVRKLANSDIVLSTYHTISHEVIDKTSPLWKIKWFRIVLDEAHIIRRMTTKLFKAIIKLHANFRWCLTGTPVQNSLEDLAALISFIRFSPLDDLYKFRRHIISPLIKGSENCVENLSRLLDSVCLRRTKQLLDLPRVISDTLLLKFSAKEQQHYTYTRDKLVKMVKQSRLHPKNKKGNLGVFQLQLQLRRLCNHGTFQKLSLDAEDFDPEQAIFQLRKNNEAICEVCGVKISTIRDIGLKARRSGSFTVCGHLCCMKCIPSLTQHLHKIDGQEGVFKCSLCLSTFRGAYFTVDEAFAKPHKAESKLLHPWQYFDKSGCSTKVSAMVKDLEEHETEGKSIVFSCWTRSLDLVGIFLKSHDLAFLRIDGSYSQVQRSSILGRFQSDSGIKILLMTTGTGAFGLNLTVANTVYLLEPQWNPMVESQAIGRVLRLGQERNVRVVRYVMKGTVEEVEMQSQQKRKIEYSKVGWNEDVCDNVAICK